MSTPISPHSWIPNGNAYIFVSPYGNYKRQLELIGVTDHCIDQLRQAVQCQSDLTPVPLFSVEGPQKKFFATHSVAHTCRDFDAVKKWGAERNKEKEPFNWNAWTG